MMLLFQDLWRLLPDRCQCRMSGCKRRGVRGKEKIVDGLRMCDECATERMHREIGLKTAQMERRLSLVDASAKIGGKYDFFFGDIVKHDEVRLKSREACLDALEAQFLCKETSAVAVLAAIQAEREAIAACRKSRR